MLSLPRDDEGLIWAGVFSVDINDLQKIFTCRSSWSAEKKEESSCGVLRLGP
jgi:hypothetical protein